MSISDYNSDVDLNTTINGVQIDQGNVSFEIPYSIRSIMADIAASGLSDIDGLTPTDGNIIVGNGSAWVAESGNTARTSLGLGTGDDVEFNSITTTGLNDVDATAEVLDLNNTTANFGASAPLYVVEGSTISGQFVVGANGAAISCYGFTHATRAQDWEFTQSSLSYDHSAGLLSTGKSFHATGSITTDGTVDGRDVAADGAKLDNIEANADVTDTANVTAAGALMDSECTDLAAVKALNQGVSTTDDPTFGDITCDTLKATAVAGIDIESTYAAITLKDTGAGTDRKEFRLISNDGVISIAQFDDSSVFINNHWRSTTNASGSNSHYFLIGSSNIQIITSSAVRPGADNTINLGNASFRWKEVFAGNGTINTSDARLKTEVHPMSRQEIAAASDLAREIGIFQFLDAVEEKGEAARRHVGLTVQRAIRIMRKRGIDPFSYGFICYDKWEETPAEYDSEGILVTPAREAGSLYSFRPDQLALFIARGQEERITRLERAIEQSQSA